MYKQKVFLYIINLYTSGSSGNSDGGARTISARAGNLTVMKAVAKNADSSWCATVPIVIKLH